MVTPPYGDTVSLPPFQDEKSKVKPKGEPSHSRGSQSLRSRGWHRGNHRGYHRGCGRDFVLGHVLTIYMALSFVLTPKGVGGCYNSCHKVIVKLCPGCPQFSSELSSFHVTYPGLHAVYALSSPEAAVSRAWDGKGWKLVLGYEGN